MMINTAITDSTSPSVLKLQEWQQKQKQQQQQQTARPVTPRAFSKPTSQQSSPQRQAIQGMQGMSGMSGMSSTVGMQGMASMPGNGRMQGMQGIGESAYLQRPMSPSLMVPASMAQPYRISSMPGSPNRMTNASALNNANTNHPMIMVPSMNGPMHSQSLACSVSRPMSPIMTNHPVMPSQQQHQHHQQQQQQQQQHQQQRMNQTGHPIMNVSDLKMPVPTVNYIDLTDKQQQHQQQPKSNRIKSNKINGFMQSNQKPMNRPSTPVVTANAAAASVGPSSPVRIVMKSTPVVSADYHGMQQMHQPSFHASMASSHQSIGVGQEMDIEGKSMPRQRQWWRSYKMILMMMVMMASIGGFAYFVAVKKIKFY